MASLATDSSPTQNNKINLKLTYGNEKMALYFKLYIEFRTSSKRFYCGYLLRAVKYMNEFGRKYTSYE